MVLCRAMLPVVCWSAVRGWLPAVRAWAGLRAMVSASPVLVARSAPQPGGEGKHSLRPLLRHGHRALSILVQTARCCSSANVRHRRCTVRLLY